MNDPKIIAWLESPEGELWRRQTFKQKHLLVLTLKDDCPSPVKGKPMDRTTVIGGYVPADLTDVPELIQQVNCG